MGVTKYVLPVIVGAMAGMILIMLGESYIHFLYPPPNNIDFYDADSVAKYIKQLPDKAFVLVIINYAVCSFLAGLIATVIAGRVSLRPALVVGIVLTLAGLYNMINLHQPLWVSLFSMLVYLPFAYFGYLAILKKE